MNLWELNAELALIYKSNTPDIDKQFSFLPPEAMDGWMEVLGCSLHYL